MNRYRHFDNEFDSNQGNSAAILPDIEIEEPFPFEFNPQLSPYSPKTNRFKQCLARRTTLERILCYLLIFLVILFSILITISISYYKKILAQSSSSLCLTPTCIEVSHAIHSGMNHSVDPCEDFHQFVCGRWIQNNLIPKGYSSWSITQEINQKNMIILKNLLEQTSMNSLTIDAEKEAIKYYQSCLNITELESLSTQPLKNYFESQLNITFEQWIHINQNQTYVDLFIRLLKFFSSKYTLAFVFPIKIDADEKNSTWNNIYIDQPIFGLGSRDYYVESTSNNQQIRDTYLSVGSDVLQLLGFDKDESNRRMSHIIQFETELAKVSLPMEILQKHDQTYHLMSIEQLQGLYQSIGLDVLQLFNELFNFTPSNSIQFDKTDQIIILSETLMSNVSTILTNYLLNPEKSHIVIDHFLFMTVIGLSSHLPLIFETKILPLKKVLLGTESPPERWQYCLRDTNVAFGFAIGAMYIERTFGENDRLTAEDLIKNIRQTFEENLNKLSWIDESTKNEAKRKLSKIYPKIGYPDWIQDSNKLNQRYAGATMMENKFFDNGIQTIIRERRRSLLKYRQKVDRTEWQMSPQTVNAYYSISSNEIVFPAGILQPPFFQKDLPSAINYGAIGSVIGHEITHGFDNQGREFDADGNMHLWWTNSSLNKFEEKSQCFIKQYSNFIVDGQNENGQRTLGENIADNGGLKISFTAYEKHREHPSTNRLPGLDYNPDQLFFIAFAHVWCNIQTKNSMHYDLINDPHSADRLRVIGTVQNSEEFAKAFSCKSNAKMNPSDKCQLW